MQFEFRVVDFIAAWIVLCVFGVAYNYWVGHLGAEGYDRGYMGFIVALGCAVTVLAGLFWPTRDLAITFVMFLAFVASGTPMILGSIRRHVKARERENKLREVRDLIEHMISEGEPLSEGQQTLLEHIVIGSLEIRDGVDLILLAAKQLHDPTYRNGTPEEQGELADTIMRGLMKLERAYPEAA